MRSFRIFMAALLALVAFTAACSSSSVDEDAEDDDTEDRPYEYPRESDVAVIAAGDYSIAGDGKVYRHVDASGQAAPPNGVSGVYDMIPLPPIGYEVAQLDEAGMQELFTLADDYGLIGRNTEPDYSEMPTDVDFDYVTVVTDEGEFEHAYPWWEDDPDGDVALLGEFSDAMSGGDLPLSDGDLGEWQPYVPDLWVVRHGYSFPNGGDGDPIEWPLAQDPEIGECVVLPTEDGVDTATGEYWFADESNLVWAAATLPWNDC